MDRHVGHVRAGVELAGLLAHRQHPAPQRDERQHLGEAATCRTLRHRTAGRGAVRRAVLFERGRGHRRVPHHRMVTQHLQRHRLLAGQRVIGGHREHPALAHQHRAVRHAVEGVRGDQHVDRAVHQARPGAGQGRLVHAHLAVRVTLGEQGHRAQQHGCRRLADVRHPQLTGQPAPGIHGPPHRRLDACDQWAHLLGQAGADRGEPDDPAGALEQRRADPAFQLAHHVADPAGAHPQPRGGPPEVQFLGQGQERLDLVPLQHRAPPSLPAGQRS